MWSPSSTLQIEVPGAGTIQYSEAHSGHRWAIIGGGLLGMTLAHRLAQDGRQVTIFEGADRLGGLASPWTLGEIVWDRHYHVTLFSDTSLRSLLAELGLEQEMRWVETRTGFFTDGKLHSLSNTIEFLRFPPLGIIDKLRLAATIFYASKVQNWRRLESLVVSEWLQRWSGNKTFNKIWLPLLRAKLGENYRVASAAFIWAIIRRMYGARRTGLKKEMFGYVPGGYARILGRFSELLSNEGVRIELSHQAKKVEPCGGEVAIEFQDGKRERFNNVVLTIPANLAAGLCPSLSETERSKLKAIQYQGVICASLLVNRPLADFYVTNITDDSIPFTAVIEMSAMVERKHFGNHCLIYLPKYVDPNDSAFALSDQEIEATFVGALERMYPHFDRSDIRCFRLSRVRQVFPIPTLNYSDKLPAIITTVPGVYISNSAYIINGTLNANETIQLANNVAKKLLTLPAEQHV